MKRLVFYFDYLSPYAYLANSQLRWLGAPIEYRPFDIRTLMPAVGNVPTSVTCKPKNTYVQADLQRWAAHYGIPLVRNPGAKDVDNRRLLRATLGAAAHSHAGELVDDLFAAMWGRPKPLATAADVAAVADTAGIIGLTPIEIDSGRWDQALTRSTDQAIAAGVFGAPTFVVGDEMFFGADRLSFVRAALAAHA